MVKKSIKATSIQKMKKKTLGVRKKIIKKKSFTIIGRNSCPYCIDAINIIMNNPNLKLDKFISTNGMSKNQFMKLKQSIKTKKTIPNTIPIILENDKYIGGFQQLSKKYT